MSFECLRRSARGAAVLVVLLSAGACREAGKTAPPASLDELSSAERTALQATKYQELGFVPQDAEAVVRVDLKALARADGRSPEMLDFLLRAQQPAAHDFLAQAGVRVADELRAIYLVVGPGRTAGAAEPFLLGGVGDLSATRVSEALVRAGGVAERGPGDAAIFVFSEGAGAKIGAHEPDRNVRVGAKAVGVAPGLILVGPPALVRRALAVRAGAERDVRESRLGREILAVATGALAWGVGRGDAADGVVAALAPGLRVGRFSAGLAPVALELRARFDTETQAESFRSKLEGLLGAAAAMAAGTQVGEAVAALRDGTRFRVEGTVVEASARASLSAGETEGAAGTTAGGATAGAVR